MQEPNLAEAAELMGLDEATLREYLTPEAEDGLMAATSNNEVKIPFEFSFFKVLGIRGEARHTHGEKWSLSLSLAALILGNEVRRQTVELNYQKLEETIDIDLAALKLKLSIGVEKDPNHLYFRIGGKVAVFILFQGWKEAEFSERIKII